MQNSFSFFVLKKLESILDQKVSRMESFVWSVTYVPTAEEERRIRTKFFDAVLKNDVQTVSELLSEHRSCELGIKEELDMCKFINK